MRLALKESRLDIVRLHREAAALANLHGPGTAVVRSAARQLMVALELLQQQHRRQDAEVLRVVSHSAAGELPLLSAAVEVAR